MSKQLIGMTDRVDFPDFDLVDIPAKVDTGAYTSSLHCSDVEVVQLRGRQTLSFRLIDKTADDSRRFFTRHFSQRMIRNSFGVAELRYVIKTRLVLFGHTFRAEFTLADRERLKNPVLLGRKILRNRFVVDVSQKDLSYQLKIDQQQAESDEASRVDS